MVHRSCRAVRLRWRQRPQRPTADIELQMLCYPSALTSDVYDPLGPLPSNPLCYIPLQSFDEAQAPPTPQTPSPTCPQTDGQPSKNRLDLTNRADAATPHLGHNQFHTRPSGMGPPVRGRGTGMKSLGGSVKGEVDRRFVAESSPKKHVRIGRGRDLD